MINDCLGTVDKYVSDFVYPGTILPQRVVMGIMGFLAIAVTFTMRACLSVAITEMVVPFNNSDSNNGSFICQVDTLPDESGHQKRIVSNFST